MLKEKGGGRVRESGPSFVQLQLLSWEIYTPMVNKRNRHQKLQEDIARLGNENEELKLEREESKKNVVHFMQEADAARQELRKAQALIAELTGSTACKSEDEAPAGLVTALSVSSGCDASTNTDERDPLQILEERWRESESQLEHAEARIKALDRELHQLRQQNWENKTPVIKAELETKSRELEKALADQARERASYETQLEQAASCTREWHEKHDRLQEATVTASYLFVFIYGSLLIFVSLVEARRFERSAQGVGGGTCA